MPVHQHSRGRALARAGAVGGLTLAAAVLSAGAASAHVTVTPDGADGAVAGGYTTLTFKVPNESADAATTKVEVDLPADTPFTSVSVEPVPGWTAEVTNADLPEPVEVHGTEVTEAPTRVVWTADEGAGVRAGQFQRFTISAGPVPEGVDELLLPATQTYSDGEVVAWDEPAAADGTEPEHPAPLLPVTGEPSGDAAAESQASADTAGAASSGDDGSGVALTLGAVGLGLGLVGAVTGVVALSRTRRADR
ncbi:YcnI family protein [Isoptericola cucumis]|uniref:YcnI family copper-binding membrane protein n=1 Tax=Isoptericola cucumis TaxID=1776856 RepID=UPI003207E55A